jgi:hypothetical protein
LRSVEFRVQVPLGIVFHGSHFTPAARSSNPARQALFRYPTSRR